MQVPTTYSNLMSYFVRKLSEIYAQDEAESITRLYFEEESGRPWHLLRIEKSVIDPGLMKIHLDHLERLLNHEPVQYVLKHAWFCNRKFFVSPEVLIPRPETEMLVGLVTDFAQHLQTLSVLEIGTGSGCIAISIALRLPHATVYATDISPGALATAKINNDTFQTGVTLIRRDVFSMDVEPDIPQVDILVSNPPYILPEESNSMLPNVIQFEPHTALFVTNNDPMQFYKALVKFAATGLKEKGMLAVEINRQYGNEVMQLFSKAGYQQIALHYDQFDQARFVTGIKNKMEN